MRILKDRKKQEIKDVFSTSNELLKYIKNENDKINTSNDTIISSINKLYYNMIIGDGVIKWNRFSRWYPKELGFKKKNVLQLEFWLERGWSDLYGKNQIKNIMVERANKATKTKRKLKNNITISGVEKYKYKTVEFKSPNHPTCKECGSNLKLKKVNIKNLNSEYFYRIECCLNSECNSHKMSKTDKYQVYLPEMVANEKIKELNDIINKSNPLCIDYWLGKGLTINEIKIKIANIQSYNSKQVKNRFIASKKNLKERGFSDEEIKLITLTPASIEFWLKKGYTKEEAKVMVSKNQSNASKHVDYEKRLLPSNIEYWLKKGYTKEEARQNVFKHQSTFSFEKCIQKYGQEEGKKRFTKRQDKWLKSLLTNGNMVIGHSKISQELFYELLVNYNINNRSYIHFATHNGEYKLEKENGGIWLYDFTDIKNKKIIEYHGDDYHGNPKKYKATDYPHPFRKNTTAQEIWDKDKQKLDIAIQNGFEIMVIWDSEYRWGNKQEIINKCINFLKKIVYLN